MRRTFIAVILISVTFSFFAETKNDVIYDFGLEISYPFEVINNDLSWPEYDKSWKDTFIGFYGTRYSYYKNTSFGYYGRLFTRMNIEGPFAAMAVPLDNDSVNAHIAAEAGFAIGPSFRFIMNPKTSLFCSVGFTYIYSVHNLGLIDEYNNIYDVHKNSEMGAELLLTMNHMISPKYNLNWGVFIDYYFNHQNSIFRVGPFISIYAFTKSAKTTEKK